MPSVRYWVESSNGSISVRDSFGAVNHLSVVSIFHARRWETFSLITKVQSEICVMTVIDGELVESFVTNADKFLAAPSGCLEDYGQGGNITTFMPSKDQTLLLDENSYIDGPFKTPPPDGGEGSNIAIGLLE